MPSALHAAPAASFLVEVKGHKQRYWKRRKDGVWQRYWKRKKPYKRRVAKDLWRYDVIVRYEGYESGKKRAFQLHGYGFTRGEPSETFKEKVAEAISEVQNEATAHYLTFEYDRTTVEVNEGSRLVDGRSLEGTKVDWVSVYFTDELKGYWEKRLFHSRG